MKRRLPFFISALLLCVSFAVLFRVPAGEGRASLSGKVASELESLLSPASPTRQPVFTPDVPQQVTEAASTIPPEAARLQELRIAAIRNGVRYGWIQLPRGTRVELLRRDGDYMLVQFEGTQVRVHRAVVEAGLIAPQARARRPVASL
jgi:hypothetical protein